MFGNAWEKSFNQDPNPNPNPYPIRILAIGFHEYVGVISQFGKTTLAILEAD
jgi:hypothetical protein